MNSLLTSLWRVQRSEDVGLSEWPQFCQGRRSRASEESGWGPWKNWCLHSPTNRGSRESTLHTTPLLAHSTEKPRHEVGCMWTLLSFWWYGIGESLCLRGGAPGQQTQVSQALPRAKARPWKKMENRSEARTEFPRADCCGCPPPPRQGHGLKCPFTS